MNRKTDHARAAFSPDARFHLEMEARHLRALYFRALFRRALRAAPRLSAQSVWMRTAP